MSSSFAIVDDVLNRGGTLIKSPLSLAMASVTTVAMTGKVFADFISCFINRNYIPACDVKDFKESSQAILAAPYTFLIKTFNPDSDLKPYTSDTTSNIFDLPIQGLDKAENVIRSSDNLFIKHGLGRLFVLLSTALKILMCAFNTLIGILCIPISLVGLGQWTIANSLTQESLSYAGLSFYYVIQLLLKMINISIAVERSDNLWV